MAEEFSKRTAANGRIVFGIGRLKRLNGVMHFIQDCYRSSDDPASTVFDMEALESALSRALIRKSDADLVDTNTKAANPGKFKDERQWPEWEKAFSNYLSVLRGVNGIPLSHVIREKKDLDDDVIYESFENRMIARAAPLDGQYFMADSRRVHNLLTGFVQGEHTEGLDSWLYPPLQFKLSQMLSLYKCNGR